MLTHLQTCEHPRLLRTSQRPSLLVAQRHAHVHPSQLSTSREPLAGTKTPAVFNMTHQPGCWAPCRGRVAPRSHPSQTLSCWDSAQGPSPASALGEARITGRGGRGFHRFSVLSICLPTRRGRAVEPSRQPTWSSTHGGCRQNPRPGQKFYSTLSLQPLHRCPPCAPGGNLPWVGKGLCNGRLGQSHQQASPPGQSSNLEKTGRAFLGSPGPGSPVQRHQPG